MFALAATISLVVWAVAHRLSERGVVKQVDIVADHMAERIRACVATRLELVSQIRREWLLGGLRDDRSFARRIDALIATFPGYLAVNRIDERGVIASVFPADTNAAALGKSLDDKPVAAAAYRAALAAHEPRMTPPLELFQRGVGVAVYVPTGEVPGAPQMVLNGVFRASTLIPACLGGHASAGYSIELRDQESLLYTRSIADEASELAIHRSFPLLDRIWTLRIVPARAMVASMMDPVRLIAVTGVGFAALLGVLVFFAIGIRDRERARRRVAEEAQREERRRIELKFQQVERMQALGQLAASIAHDFNNLLTIIMTSTHFLGKASDLRDVEAIARDIDTAAQKGATLTKELVLFGRGDERPAGPVDLAAIVRALRNLLARLGGPTITLAIDCPEQPAMLFGSTVQLEQIIVNLASNAVAAMPAGGALSIAVRGTDTSVVLRVEDTGSGIDPRILPRIFEPFFTTKAENVGTGLGLATVYGHVHRMGGEITVESTLEIGTCFVVTFPKLRNQAP